jgi:hypothetical protein
MIVSTHPSWGAGNARLPGALAGLVPALAVAGLFAVSGSAATPPEVAVSLALVTLIAMTAGWFAGPLAAGERRRLVVAALGYAIAVIATTAVLSMVQGAWDIWTTAAFDPIATAIAGRALSALVSTIYLIVPATVLGMIWSVTARGLTRRMR